ncbi:uncharacterized protein N7482_000591 [Penicillium canariense]|uniref:Uncharacterized protein n=1 Tax=Penicillium canariense TaxID=189055 RepID=A0A9W9IBW0_9EURO|nr:uncharacterized protein N7482_000591 [Penicillium canariense]KAJ5174714.1 hypothetical protein N7482_000591 [Penicillium canariense]
MAESIEAQRYWRALGLLDDMNNHYNDYDRQIVTEKLRDLYYGTVDGDKDLRFATNRRALKQTLAYWLREMPDTVKQVDRKLGLDILYELFKLFRLFWRRLPPPSPLPSREEVPEEEEASDEPEKEELQRFQKLSGGFAGPGKSRKQEVTTEPTKPGEPEVNFEYVDMTIWNARVSIVQASHPNKKFLSKLDLFTRQPIAPKDQNQDGRWINVLNLDLGTLTRGLTGGGTMKPGQSLWWSPKAHKNTNFASTEGQTRLANNISLRVTVWESFDGALEGFRGKKEHTLQHPWGIEKPSFTVIIRDDDDDEGERPL